MKENQILNQDLLDLEQSLKARLSPVKPDQNFVGNLRSRLEDSPIYQQQRETAYFLLSIASGLLVGSLIFLIGKGIIYGLRQT
jgi:hypothetical protein